MVGRSKTQGSTVQTKPLGVAAPRGFIFVSHGGLHFISFRDNYTTYIYFFQAIKNYSAGKANKKTVSTIVETVVGCGGRI